MTGAGCPCPDTFLLPAHHYTDAAWMQPECDRIFRRSWQYLPQAALLQPPHTCLGLEVAGAPLVLTRDGQGHLRAFYNVCPHRAALLCPTSGPHTQKHLVCPYHGWTYDLTGQLVGLPRGDRFSPEVQPQDYPLTPVRLEPWQGFWFLCLDFQAPPLVEVLQPIPQWIRQHRRAGSQPLVHKTYSVACNWKVYHDNTLCDYHVAIAHRTTLHKLQGPVHHYRHHFHHYVNCLYTPTPAAWRDRHPRLEGLDDEAGHGFYTFGIFPNLHLLAMPDGVLAWIQITPLAVDRCQVSLDIHGIPGLSPAAETLLADFEAFMAEDMAITRGGAAWLQQWLPPVPVP
ncbi:Rieske domain/chlorophyllide a oxygenase domain protein [Halomicronema hongdechloris C2206]|uniref:Rieske domain/chlorophyllide a oxygenase domain protein n=1 Tax=Halomicronema hongdechloris C2206 TaxID=1641165 RepID=A0A1Z3HLB0_9CYAN|nr:Rieske 2Fe-2S domain-containing protein [Halomicronema hongdechloris]ASC71078.1 Rieske domain/chlorophyllide a oxygenase domain protein [Halomicronema hongdechloris C2206]